MNIIILPLYGGRITAILFLFRLETIFGVVAVFQGIGVSGFHHYHVFVIALADIIHIGFQRANRTIPVGVHRQTNDVVRHVALADFIKPPAEGVVFRAFGQMKHNFNLLAAGEVFLQAVNGGVKQPRQAIELAAALPPAFALRPQHTAVDLVADLDHIRQHPLLLKAGNRVAGVVMNGGFQLRIIHFLPGLRLELLARIGPEIAIVKIKQQLHTLRFCALRQRQRRRQIVIAAAVTLTLGVFWIHPQAQANIVHAVGLQNRDRILRLITVVKELRAVLFRIQQRGDIRAFNKISGHIAKRLRLQRICRQRTGGKTACQRNSKPRGC